MKSIRILMLVIAGAAPGWTTLPAQTAAPEGEVVDRVVAVVGDSVVLQTDIEEALLRLAAEGRRLPDDPVGLTRLRRELLQARMDELMLVQAAERDSVVLPQEEVDSRVQRDIAQYERALGGERALVQALEQQGQTLVEFREELAKAHRRELLAQLYLEKVRRERRPPPVSEHDVRTFFEANRDQLGERPATISFRQIVVTPKASDSARAEALARAEEALEQIRSGQDFAQLARRFSDDPGSRERGGDLGWFRQQQMVPEFSRVAFAMRPGDVSGIVESGFGFHVIKLEKVRGAERQARHILFRPEVTADDVERARGTAEEIAERLRDGEPVDPLIERYHDADEESRIGPFPTDRLPDPYDRELAGTEPGAVVGPFALGDAAGRKWAVVRVTEVAAAGEYSLDDPMIRSQIRAQLEHQKLIEEVLAELRRRTHVDLRL